MMRRRTGMLLLATLLLSRAVNVGAATITAASCNVSDVQSALNRAVAGDTVVIPAGICHWTSGVEWNAPANVTLRGAGNETMGGGNATVIIDDYESSLALMRIWTAASGTFRLANLTLKGGSISNVNNTKFNGLITFGGSSKQLRVDHVTCNLRTYTPAMSARCIYFTGWLYGVVDHSIFELPNNTGQAIQFAHNGYGDLTDGDGSWAADTAFGSNQFMFAEDNIINSLTRYGTAQDCVAGGKFVWRYNTMHAASLQTHPTGGAGRGRGCRASEIYANTFANGGLTEPLFNVFFISSGTAMVWGNTTPSPSEFKHFITFHAMRASNNTYAQSPTPDGWGYCGTAFNGTGSNWDGNTSQSSGYPCLDQPGRGKGDRLSGTFPNVKNSATGCSAGSPCAWPRQAAEPIYMWRNPFTPMPGWGGSFVGGNVAGVAQNRDWVTDLDANCPAGGATCASGVGVGTRAERPRMCVAGTAWWSTDQGGNWNTSNTSGNDGTLDRCAATNAWTDGFYTPYAYPHPLVTGTTPPTPPAAPTNVVVR